MIDWYQDRKYSSIMPKKTNSFQGCSKGQKSGGQVVMRSAAATRRRLLICQNLGGQLPLPLLHPWFWSFVAVPPAKVQDLIFQTEKFIICHAYLSAIPFHHFHQEMVFCYQNYSDLLWVKLFYWWRKTFEIRGWRLRICKIFGITRTIYSNSERSEQIFVTECFFNLFLEFSHV